jgi:hypothetical protein
MKTRTVPAIVLAVAAGASVTVLAHAGAFGQRAGTETWTEPSGVAGALTADLLTTVDYNGLQTIKVREYDKRACVLEVEESPFATPMLALLPPVKVCEPTGGELWKRMDVGAGVFITALAVCTTGVKGDAAIQGVEAWGSVLQPDGTLTGRKGSEKIEFPACKKWQARRSCPVGAVGTGVRGFYEDKEHGFVGMSLRCHMLEPRGRK